MLESNYEKLNEKSISGVKFPTIHNKYPVDNVTKTTDLRQLTAKAIFQIKNENMRMESLEHELIILRRAPKPTPVKYKI